MDPSVVAAWIVLAGMVSVAALGLIKDTSAAKRLQGELDRLEKRDKEWQTRDDHRSRIIIALRHYINVLIYWGAHSKDEPPRQPPEPPESLTGDGQDD